MKQKKNLKSMSIFFQGNGANFAIAVGEMKETALHLAAKIDEHKGDKCTKMLLKSGIDAWTL